jgi:rhodanese-related sulfurtransferase
MGAYSGWSALVPAGPHTDITAAQAYAMIYCNSYPNLVILDVRNPADFAAGQIPGAINVPVLTPSPFDTDALNTWLQSAEGQSHKNHEIIVYCKTGTRSNLASRILDGAGFTKVHDMLGGYTAWSALIIAVIDIKPDTLNLKSNGKWVTCYIELPTPYSVSDINVTTVKLNDAIPAAPCPTGIGDFDRDGVNELMVKFARKQVESLLSVGEKKLWVTFALNDGKLCVGCDKIKVISCQPTPHWYSHWQSHWDVPEYCHTPLCR